MQIFSTETRRIAYLMSLNWDRIAVIGMLYACLSLASWLVG